jgi:two-component system, cell cycle sensor histidine kinase and response regulator CckA
MTADPRPRILSQAVLDAMPGAVAQLSPTGEILGVNAAWRTLAVSIRRHTTTDVMHGDNYLAMCDRIAAAGSELAANGAAAIRLVLRGHSEPVSLEYEMETPSGMRWFELIVTRLEGSGHHGALVTHVDVTPRKAAAEALRRTETQYRAIVESAPVGIYQTTRDGRILAANQSLAEIIAAGSAADLVGMNITSFYANAGEREALIAQHQPETASTPHELEWKRLDGVPIWVEMAARAITDPMTGATLSWEGFVYDISERKRLEAQLIQAQKMESVGRLAGGIAHDFNNLLTVMIGYAELLHTADEIGNSHRLAAGEILAAARRAAELTGRMLAFARKQRVQPRAISVNDILRGVQGLLGRIIGEDVRLEVYLADDLPAVLIDPTQLEQVMMNLAVNARDAMPQGGRLTISSDFIEITEEEARRQPGQRPGPHVRIAMTDTGVGMDAETLKRVFEPFFTTKDPGKGTGLGLAMCYGIVKQANGFIGCDSSIGVGTTCTVYLPAASGAAESAEPSAPVASQRSRAASPAARILVVEDEPVVRQFVAEILRASGHVVHVTGSPHEGLEIAATERNRLDLLLTDVVMPQMDGVTLAARIRAEQPEVRVLLMSGYQDRASAATDTSSALLPKPFTAAQLRDRVDEVLRSAK